MLRFLLNGKPEDAALFVERGMRGGEGCSKWDFLDNLLDVIPNSKKVVTVLISKFRPAEKTTVAIFYEIGIR
ncbi:hypothetical protein CYANOKiyG1_34070 [Okeania sp. KiyG1]|nr:hypothetical protein CYANOKiyG1_34070 [Okeania sp. KiyG1]